MSPGVALAAKALAAVSGAGIVARLLGRKKAAASSSGEPALLVTWRALAPISPVYAATFAAMLRVYMAGLWEVGDVPDVAKATPPNLRGEDAWQNAAILSTSSSGDLVRSTTLALWQALADNAGHLPHASGSGLSLDAVISSPVVQAAAAGAAGVIGGPAASASVKAGFVAYGKAK